MITVVSFSSLLSFGSSSIVSNKLSSKMSLAASSSLATLASTASSASASSLSNVAAGGEAAAPLFSTWVSAFSNNSHLVGSAWIISSAILTTYSTTKFLKYQGEEPSVMMPSSSKGSIFSLGRNKEKIKQQQNVEPQNILQGKKSIPVSKLSRASLLTLYRFSGSLLLGLFMHAHFYQLSALLPRFVETLEAAKLFLLPSLFLFIANYCNSIALDRIGISLTYTSKCGIPLITVLFTLLLDGVSALPSKATLLSLLPIAIGIGAASWNSPTFEMFGFVAAMISTTSQAALNVVSKRVMRKTGIRGAEAQRAMVFVALGIGLAMAGANSVGERFREWREYGASIRGSAVEEGDSDTSVLVQSTSPSHPPLWLTALAVFAYHMEYVLSFCFVGLVEPITYGTCDALRRLLIIIAGRQIFGGDRFSKANMSGIGLALLGAVMYSITSSRGGTLVPPPMGKK
jgi:drug/metabolite transporter (DMT)-like permease